VPLQNKKQLAEPILLRLRQMVGRRKFQQQVMGVQGTAACEIAIEYISTLSLHRQRVQDRFLLAESLVEEGMLHILNKPR
jgi:hypothetical protein